MTSTDEVIGMGNVVRSLLERDADRLFHNGERRDSHTGET
jgi:hypothetical protein